MKDKKDYDFILIADIKKDGSYITRYMDGKNDVLKWVKRIKGVWYWYAYLIVPVGPDYLPYMKVLRMGA